MNAPRRPTLPSPEILETFRAEAQEPTRQPLADWERELIAGTSADRQEICTDAINLISGDRQRDYGTPTENLGRIAAMWTPLLGVEVTPKHVALCMVALKLAREVNTPKRDNIVDGIGYLLIAAEVDK